MKIDLRGERFKLTWEKLKAPDAGECVHKGNKRRIRIHPGMSPKAEFETLIHEMLHGCLWDLDENAIEESGKSIAEVLWTLGYRKVIQ